MVTVSFHYNVVNSFTPAELGLNDAECRVARHPSQGERATICGSANYNHGSANTIDYHNPP